MKREREREREYIERNTEEKDKIVLIKIRERITRKDRGKAMKANLLIQLDKLQMRKEVEREPQRQREEQRVRRGEKSGSNIRKEIDEKKKE